MWRPPLKKDKKISVDALKNCLNCWPVESVTHMLITGKANVKTNKVIKENKNQLEQIDIAMEITVKNDDEFIWPQNKNDS